MRHTRAHPTRAGKTPHKTSSWDVAADVQATLAISECAWWDRNTCSSDDRRVRQLRYDEADDEWTLQRGFDGDELLARLSIQLVTADADLIRRAEKETESCKRCHPADAQIPFDWILRDVAGKHGPYEFLLVETARCPT